MTAMHEGPFGQCALVTGATGMIGGAVAARLVAAGWEVLALIRVNGHSGQQRMLERLRKSGEEIVLDQRAFGILAGDTLAKNLGLSADAARAVSLIVHCAGETSFKASASCWKTNVGGIREVIDFARSRPVPPRLIYVSTAAVCMGPCHSEITEDDACAGYSNAYTASKRRAEELVLDSSLDVVVVRPSIVLSRGIRDRRMARSVLWALPAAIKVGRVPIDPSSRLDLVPIDYVADVICKLATKPSLSYRSYHVSAGAEASVRCADLIETAAGRYRFGGALELAGAAAEVQPRTRIDAKLLRRLSVYLPFLNADVVYSTQRLRGELQDDMPVCARATDYLDELLVRVSVTEAMAESSRP